MLLGLRNRLPVPVVGWTSQASPTVSSILPLVQQFSNITSPGPLAANRVYATSSPYEGTGIFQPGTLGISPTHWAERQFRGDTSAGQVMWRGVWQAGLASGDLFPSFKEGSWLRGRMTIKTIYYHNGGAPSVTTFINRTYRNGAQVTNTVVTPSGTGVFGYSAPANSATPGHEPWIQVINNTATEGVYDGTAVAESSLAILGAHLEQTDAQRGVSVTPISNAGWSAEAHASTALCSDTNLRGYLTAVGVPNMVLIMLGHNLTTNEVSGGVLQAQWKTNVEAVVARYKAQLEAAGEKNIVFLLVTPWYAEASGGYADTIINDQAQAMHEIARDTSSGLVGHVNGSALCGSGASLVAAGYLGAADIHPQSEAAVNFLFEKIVMDGVFGSGGARLRPARRWGGR